MYINIVLLVLKQRFITLSVLFPRVYQTYKYSNHLHVNLHSVDKYELVDKSWGGVQ